MQIEIAREKRSHVYRLNAGSEFTSDHFSGPGKAISLVCVWLCVRTTTFERSVLKIKFKT